MERLGTIDVKDPELIRILSNITTLKRPKGNPGGRKCKYKNVVCAFDIETTRLKKIEQSVMYIWQFQIGMSCTVIGRTWDEFISLLQIMADFCEDNEYYMIFVHNLSYEFQFLAGIYNFMPEEVFAMESRKVVKCSMMSHFEFRCSYIHSNMSLDQFTHKYGVEYAKLHDFDYSKIRYPWTELSDQELAYCINDVKGLVEVIYKEMDLDGDSLYTIPLTSTGYVRRDVKKSMRTYNRDTLQRQLPSWDIYTMLNAAFRGGNTHANRFFAGDHIGVEDLPFYVYSRDRSSSYPDVLCNEYFPVGRWFFEPEHNLTFQRLDELMNRRHKAVLMTVQFFNIRLRDPLWGCPYLSTAKCFDILKHDANYNFDNGRILGAKAVSTTITDIDLRIIMEEYVWDDMQILSMASSTYGKLPNQLTDTIRRYYINKTELKGVAGQEIYYDKEKALLNGIYGLLVCSPVKPHIVFNCRAREDEDPFTLDQTDDYPALLQKSNNKAFGNYAWGIWCTAWARYRLEEGIRLVHRPEEGSYFIYADTDSVKYMCDNDEVKAKIDIEWRRYNQERIRASRSSGSYATDPKGKQHYMGVFESEGYYREFATLGAKKYCYRDEDDKLHITIAGVGKKAGAEELEAAGGIEAFKEGFLFIKAGGTESVYNDIPKVKQIKVDGHTLNITRNIVIKDSTYRLGITGEYERLLNYPLIYLKVFDTLNDTYYN